MKVAYLDSSAFVKTFVAEPESRRLVDWLRHWPARASCALLRTEAVRVARAYGPEVVAAVRSEFHGLQLVALDEVLLDAAGELAVSVRSLDAIHLTAARSLGEDLGVIVTYDERMIRGARELGLETVSP